PTAPAPPTTVTLRFIIIPRGFAPRTPLHALSRAASPPRSVRVARFAALARVCLYYSAGLRPSDSPTPSLAGPLRPAPLRWLASPRPLASPRITPPRLAPRPPL